MPINKPLDRICKAFPDEAPRMFLHAVGVVPLDAEALVEVLPQETAPPVVLPDVAFRISVPGQPPFIFHAEIEGRFRPGKLPKIARYGGSFVAQHNIPIRTSILLLVPLGNPAIDHGVAVFAVEGTEIRHSYKIIRLWELDPAPILNAKDPRLFPWAMLMKSSDADVRAIGAELGRLGDEELLGRFYILGGLRYHREELTAMTGGAQMSLAEIVFEESSVFTDLKAKIVADGKATEALQLLRAALSAKFPGLESLPELDSIRNIEALESILIRHVVGGSDRAVVEQAIRNAV